MKHHCCDCCWHLGGFGGSSCCNCWFSGLTALGLEARAMGSGSRDQNFQKCRFTLLRDSSFRVVARLYKALEDHCRATQPALDMISQSELPHACLMRCSCQEPWREMQLQAPIAHHTPGRLSSQALLAGRLIECHSAYLVRQTLTQPLHIILSSADNEGMPGRQN